MISNSTTSPTPVTDAMTPDVKAKADANIWDNFRDVLPTLKAISRGEWFWGANSRCKYIELRIDTRDGGCILYDRDRVRISPEQFAFQSNGRKANVDPWPTQVTDAELSNQGKPHFPERDANKPAEQQGIFNKFEVHRVDGSDKPGGKHHGCRYFVLDIDHDPYAKEALAAYAEACEKTHPVLASGLREMLGSSNPKE